MRLFVNELGQIADRNPISNRIIEELTALFSVDENGATLQKLSDFDYVDNILKLHKAAFPEDEENYYVLFKMSELTSNKHEQLKISEYFITHTLSDTVKNLVVEMKKGNKDEALKISKKML